MELGSFNDFFKAQMQPSITIPAFYFNDQKWGYVEVFGGVIVSSPITDDDIKTQEINILHNYIRGWCNNLFLGLEWKHQMERQKLTENIQKYIDDFYPILKGPENIVRMTINREYTAFVSLFQFI